MVVQVEVVDGAVTQVLMVRNPDKLAGLAAPSGHRSGPVAVQCRGSQEELEVGETPTRSRHCVSPSSQLGLESDPPSAGLHSTGRRNPGGQMTESHASTTSRPAAVAVPVLPVRQVLPWLLFAALLALVALYFVSAEEGATSLISGTAVHEWVHDSRHLLGFPCH